GCGEGVILRTTDGGESWNRLDLATALADVFFVDADTGIAVGTDCTQAVILRTSDGGASWTRQPSPTPSGLGGAGLADGNTGTAGSGSEVTVHTTDGGEHWSVRHTGSGSLRRVAFGDANTGTAVGSSAILHTTDGGFTWAREDRGNVTL